ncbi:uncharacterized protein At3g28850-like [Amaranthus tricolor]|uniref:uncharacterized protein At3g28850-like n=1 Tax=Amaranthus tricolor TaxID=29722 RepID=UPI00258F9F63|nr:uncharacterized protein At3g28850-like [Amaranthus tricolor]
MKGMKGKFLKKLKSVKQIGYLNPDRILQVSNFDGFVDNFQLKYNFVDNFTSKSQTKSNCSPKPKFEKPEVIDVVQLIKEFEEDEEQENHDDGQKIKIENEKFDDKENIYSSVISKDSDYELKNSNNCSVELEKSIKESDSEIKISCFRRPDMNSISLFDPKLLAAFEKAVKDHITIMKTAEIETTNKNHKYPFFQPEDQSDPLMESDNEIDPLTEFEEKCPPGGSNSVIFYTTSLRGIRKTFEDCQSIRFLLQSFGLIYYERDVSIHSEFREELWKIMGERCLPPRLFIRGRYIGGAEKVLALNEQGKLRPLFRDIPINFSEGPCNVCSGLRFMLCYNCNGSRKVYEYDDDHDLEDSHGGLWSQCSQCNENGLVVCPLC